MSRYQSQAPEEDKQVSTSPGKLKSLYAANVSGSTRYVFVFNGTSASDPLIAGPFPVAASQGARFEWEAGEGPSFGEGGLYIASSSTIATFTASNTADFFYNAVYGHT